MFAQLVEGKFDVADVLYLAAAVLAFIAGLAAVQSSPAASLIPFAVCLVAVGFFVS
jgi:hypothetical protein